MESEPCQELGTIREALLLPRAAGSRRAGQLLKKRPVRARLVQREEEETTEAGGGQEIRGRE